MAMRRPRLKAAVNLAPRRAALGNSGDNAKTAVPEPQPSKAPAVEAVEPPIAETPIVPHPILPTPPAEVESSPEPIAADGPTAEPVVKPLAPRRLIKPAVCLPLRKRKIPSNDATADTTAAPDVVPQTTASQPQDPIPHPLEDVSTPPTITTPPPPLPVPDTPSAPHFKPPFLSPSMQHGQHQKRTDVLVHHHPFAINDENRPGDLSDDATSQSGRQPPPQSPSKVRQRIRPTPCFGYHRRNSMSQGGNDSESDAEPTKRQRLISSSSTHSVPHVPQAALHRNASASAIPNRMRTESVCSVMSDVTPMRDLSTKPKKNGRSEEFQRILHAKREFSARFQGVTPDKARLTMFDMIFYNPSTNPMKNPAVKSRRPSTSSSAASAGGAGSIKGRRSSNASSVASAVSKFSSPTVSSTKSIKMEKRDDPSDDHQMTKMPVPQLKLGPNGEIMLDEKSLVIETTGDKEARETLANADIVYDDEFSGTSGFYKRSKRTRDWPPDETLRFYRCLHTIGTDFSLMLTLFPNRSRRDMKLKFKKEERNNPALINKALMHPKLFDIDELKRDFQAEEARLESERVKWEETKKQEADLKKDILKATKRNRTCISHRTMSAGDKLHELADKNSSKCQRKPQINNDDDVVLPFNELNRTTQPDADIDEWFDINEATIDHAMDDVENMDGELITGDVIQDPFRMIDIADVPMSCKRDFFSDQFVESAAQALQSDDILNMEIIFDDDEERMTSNGMHPIDDGFFNQSIEGLHIQSISKCEKDQDAQTLHPLVVNDIIYMNTKESAVAATKQLGGPIEAVSNEDVVYFDALPLNKNHTSQESNQQQSPLIGSTGDALLDEQAASLSPADHVPDIEHQIADTSDDSQHSHGSLVAAPMQQTHPKLEQIEEVVDKVETKATVCESDDHQRSGDGAAQLDDVVVDDIDSESDDDDEALASLADSLVVVARQDADGNIVHEVFLMSPTTNCLSDEPLDLPAEVIERIRSSLTVQPGT